MTGYLDKTSALYIFIKPELTFDQVATPLMFHSWFECSANGPFFTLKMNLMQPRNIKSLAKQSTMSWLGKDLGGNR